MNLLEWSGLTTSRKPLDLGDAAPEVETRDDAGNFVRTRDLYGDGFALVYFYPKADTPGCAAQACSLRDDFATLQDRGARVIGVSSDGPEAQARFKKKFNLPFMLLADTDHVVARAFGVRLLLGMTQRQSFLFRGRRLIWRDLSASTREQGRDVIAALEESTPFVP